MGYPLLRKWRHYYIGVAHLQQKCDAWGKRFSNFTTWIKISSWHKINGNSSPLSSFWAIQTQHIVSTTMWEVLHSLAFLYLWLCKRKCFKVNLYMLQLKLKSAIFIYYESLKITAQDKNQVKHILGKLSTKQKLTLFRPDRQCMFLASWRKMFQPFFLARKH